MDNDLKIELKFYGNIYCLVQNFGIRKLWQITAQKVLGRENIAELGALHSKSARVKLVGRMDWSWIIKCTNRVFLCQSFVHYSTIVVYATILDTHYVYYINTAMSHPNLYKWLPCNPSIVKYGRYPYGYTTLG